ncbi:MAG: carboxypeptidase-like regulatory domain-containing protein, partial [Bacteroidaceae bacterium]|nr:carboxypeptidase-like regulatory domain-containing protein [Bacteroidaceae bacterium]
MKLKTVGISLLAAALFGYPLCAIAPRAMAETNVMQQDGGVVRGVVKDTNGEPVFGAIVFVVGTTNSAQVDFDGNYKLDFVKKGVTVRAQMMGYTTKDLVWNGGALNFVLEEETSQLEELVVTAMGIMRKEKSLTYATQQIKAADLLQVQDVNLVNSLEGKISGITITPSAGGAGGASKILLRGNKSIMGDNAPLIVVDGVPMTNGVRG